MFHTTSVNAAIEIVSSGGLMVGGILEGPSFSANGLSHPKGGTTMEHRGSHVAFVAQYDQLRAYCHATNFPEGFREYEQEVRSPLPIPTGLMIGVVPIDPELFPDILRTGYSDDTLIGGDSIASWSRNYVETGTMFSDTQRSK